VSINLYRRFAVERQEADARLRRMPRAHTRGGGKENGKAGGQRPPFLPHHFQKKPPKNPFLSIVPSGELSLQVRRFRPLSSSCGPRMESCVAGGWVDGWHGCGSPGFRGCWLGAEQMCWLLQPARFQDQGKEERKQRGEEKEKKRKRRKTSPPRPAVGPTAVLRVRPAAEREGDPPPQPSVFQIRF